MADSLRLETDAPAEIPLGEPVPITLRVRNVARRPLDLSLVGRTIAFDVVVTDSEGGEIWSRLRGQTVQSILRVEHLEPNGVLELTDEWTQQTNGGGPVAAGEYIVHGMIPTDTHPLRTPDVQVRIR